MLAAGGLQREKKIYIFIIHGDTLSWRKLNAPKQSQCLGLVMFDFNPQLA